MNVDKMSAADLLREGKVDCCVCDGTGVRPFFPGNGYKGPNRIPCGRCKGTGWMAQPPKKP